MINKLKDLTKESYISQDLDAIAVGVLDFNTQSFECFEVSSHAPNLVSENPEIYFDLASLSKPLINGAGFLHDESIITEQMKLVGNHRAGIPAWGLLPKHGWKELIEAYKISESDTLYSDYSAIRFMLEYDLVSKRSLREVASTYWDDEVLYWLDLTNENKCVQNGFVKGVPNIGKVHDPNAYNLAEFVSHAGTFGTITGVCKTLMNFEKNLNLIEKMSSLLCKSSNRFNNGWDRVENTENTLAGSGATSNTFGHLGFTGTSIWIDADKKVGHVILTNATKNYWFAKSQLNIFRKEVGRLVWEKNLD